MPKNKGYGNTSNTKAKPQETKVAMVFHPKKKNLNNGIFSDRRKKQSS